jgi:hypothetical protein
MEAEIKVILADMSNKERALPQHFPDNHAAWRL